MYQLLAEQFILFRWGDFIAGETVRQRVECGVRKSHRPIERLIQKLFDGLHGDGFHHILQQEEIKVAVLILLLFQLAVGNFVSDGVGIVLAQIEMVGHLNVEMLGLIRAQIPLVTHNRLVERDERRHSRGVGQQFLQRKVGLVSTRQIRQIFADFVGKLDFVVVV